MPLYKADVTVYVDGDDVDWLYHAIDQLADMDGVSVTNIAPYSDNPEDYPEYDDA